jgi:predicted GIY-YIG superfamily endonuclease
MQETVAQRVYREIMAHMSNSGTPPSRWYVGITSDPRKRLFTDHNVSKDDHYIYLDAESETTARLIEAFIINEHHTKGDLGGGDKSTTFVYAYVITNHTRQ